MKDNRTMKKINAIFLNNKIGNKIFDESVLDKLVLIKYTNKQIKDLCIDDLIKDGKWTTRLATIVHEIQENEVM